MSFRLLFALATLLPWVSAFSQTPRDYAVDLKVTPSTTEPRITLTWSQRQQAAITAQQIYRRLKGEVTWNLLATLSTTDTSYADAAAVEGVEYEYWMKRTYTGFSVPNPLGYINAAINLPMVENRGTLLLVIDDTVYDSLVPEILQLQQDLAADGWSVQTLLASRLDTAANVKAIIKAAYDVPLANVKQVFLLGHVPVPYSGNSAWDGHGNHSGGWSADSYYGDMNGTWTDTSVNNPSTSAARVPNVPGDGIFDQSTIPSALELMVGRVDFANMQRAPSTSTTEVSLLRRYLKRAHDFRYKQGAYANVQRRVLIRDGFGYFSGEAFARTGWEWAFTTVGRPPEVTIDEAPSGNWWTLAANNTYLMAHGCGGGSYETCGSVGATADFGRRPFRAVFTTLFGSYFGDWDTTNNFLRAPLAGNATEDGLALSCFWAGRPTWFMHHMSMGETLGYAVRQSINSQFSSVSNPVYTPINFAGGGTHCGLMGDPALRMHIVEPPRDLTATSGNGIVNLAWSASTEPSLLGYHVYRAVSPEGPYTRLTTSPLVTASFDDGTGIASATYTYMVRTLKLETSPGGTYENLSQGAVATIAVNSSSTVRPRNPTSLAVNQLGSGNTQLTWKDNAPDATGYRVQRKSGVAGSFGTIATLPPGSTSHTDTTTLANNNVYYYRVLATGSSLNSITTDEVGIEATPGYFEFDSTVLKVNRSVGVVSIPVKRFGGVNGSVSVNYATANSSAFAGSDYSATSGTLNWANGEAGTKLIEVPLIAGGPTQPRQFRVTLSSPSSGTGIGTYNALSVLIEDAAATLPVPWSQAIVGGISNFSPAVLAEGGIASATIGGTGLSAVGTAETGQFIYQPRTGDGSITAFIPAASPAQSGSRYAVMIRENATSTGARMAATLASSTTTVGCQLAYRTTTSGNSVFTGSALTSVTPVWVRLTRIGNNFTSECSADGSTWTNLGTVTIAMNAAAQWGLFHHSDDISGTTYAGNFQTAVFQNATVGPIPVPAAPASFTGSTPSTTRVTLNWNTSTFASAYRIERRAENGVFKPLTTLGAVTTFNDDTVVADAAYEYRIYASNSSGSSPAPTTLRAVTPSSSGLPARPSFFTAAAITPGAFVSLEWTDNTASETGFRIERRLAGGAFALLQTTPANAVGIIDTTAVSGNTYEYRICATSAGGNSAWSLIVSVIAGVNAGHSTGLMTYADWLQQEGQPANLPDAEDLDADGIRNVIEFALGLPVASPDTNASPAPGFKTIGGQAYLTLTFARRIDASGISLRVEVATSLAGPWTIIDPLSVANQAASQPDVPAPGWQTLTIKDVAPYGGSASRFMRLRVDRP